MANRDPFRTRLLEAFVVCFGILSGRFRVVYRSSKIVMVETDALPDTRVARLPPEAVLPHEPAPDPAASVPSAPTNRYEIRVYKEGGLMSLRMRTDNAREALQQFAVPGRPGQTVTFYDNQLRQERGSRTY